MCAEGAEQAAFSAMLGPFVHRLTSPRAAAREVTLAMEAVGALAAATPRFYGPPARRAPRPARGVGAPMGCGAVHWDAALPPRADLAKRMLTAPFGATDWLWLRSPMPGARMHATPWSQEVHIDSRCFGIP